MRWTVDSIAPLRAAGPATALRFLTRDVAAPLFSVRGRYEAGLIFVILLIVEWIIPGPASLARIAPHPFWIPVILISVQYGSASGLFVAVVAACLSWVVGWPAQSGSEDYFTYSLRVWREPVLWMIGALVVGGLRNREIKDRRAIHERLVLAETQRDTIGSYALELQEELTRCERKVATTEVSSAEAAVEALSALRGDTPAETLPVLHAAIASWMGSARWTFHGLDGDIVVSSLGPRGAGPPPSVETAFKISVVHAIALRHMAVLSVFEAAQAALLEGLGVYACSIPRGRGGSHGLLVIETLPAHRLTDATAEAVAMIAGALGERLDRQTPQVVAVSRVREVQDGPTVAVVLRRGGGVEGRVRHVP
ncbi:hypothetical protein PMNALOAF_0856 [Methylobacterium adhaesivum]|jgi:hypothetical protein|nr:hypothetical protein PMNALOAF_0856 [Methylobacterium adhaesivum]